MQNFRIEETKFVFSQLDTNIFHNIIYYLFCKFKNTFRLFSLFGPFTVEGKTGIRIANIQIDRWHCTQLSRIRKIHE